MTATITKQLNGQPWTAPQKFGLRLIFLYVIQLCIPFRGRFYENLLQFGWIENWQALSGLTGIGSPEYIDVGTDIWELYSYINLIVSFGIALGGAAIWSIIDRKPRNYDNWYYWIIVVARYRAALGIIAWGMKKFIPKQMELPSITFLHTPFADFSEQKVYWQSVGITPNYEIFLGFAEILAGLLLLFRKTTPFGAALLTVMLFNICIANHAYDGMVHVGSFTYVILGIIVLWKYLPAIWALIALKKDAYIERYYPSFKGWKATLRFISKTAIIGIFIVYSFYLHSADYVGYRFPHNHPGLVNSAGVYEVTEFRLNNKVLPYDPTDSIRWQDAIFERWSTLTFKVNRLQEMDNANTGREGKESISKRFEFRGIGGGRHYFDYKTDTINRLIKLINKNAAHRDQQYTLHYTQESNNRIILNGINEHKDSVYIILDRKHPLYPLYGYRSLPEKRPALISWWPE